MAVSLSLTLSIAKFAPTICSFVSERRRKLPLCWLADLALQYGGVPLFPHVYTKEATFSISFDGSGGAPPLSGGAQCGSHSWNLQNRKNLGSRGGNLFIFIWCSGRWSFRLGEARLPALFFLSKFGLRNQECWTMPSVTLSPKIWPHHIVTYRQSSFLTARLFVHRIAILWYCEASNGSQRHSWYRTRRANLALGPVSRSPRQMLGMKGPSLYWRHMDGEQWNKLVASRRTCHILPLGKWVSLGECLGGWPRCFLVFFVFSVSHG